MAVTLPVGSILYFDTGTDAVNPTWTKLTEHNREPVSIDTNRIEKQQRMANGTMRKQFTADKKIISTSWVMLPSYSTMTLDNGYGAVDLKTFYLNKGTGSFKIKISYNAVAARDEVVTVVFSSCSQTLVKRNVKAKSSDAPQEFWDVSIGLEEV
jgi:hypothetical protein